MILPRVVEIFPPRPLAAPAIVVRALTMADAPRIQRFFEGLSQESMYRRFLVSKPVLTRGELRAVSAPADGRREALVAIAAPVGFVVGLGELGRWHDRPQDADFAVVVADDWRRQGIGTALGQRLVRAARERGLHSLTASTHTDNLACQELLARLGFAFETSAAGVDELRLRL
jgi:acetyltransferase